MATAASLLTLLNTNADINYYTQQLTYWSNLYEGNQAKLSKQVKAEEKWMDSYDDALYAEKDIKMNGSVYIEEGASYQSAKASVYADHKVKEYNRELSESLADLDIEYDTMKTMYDAMLQSLNAQKESEKQLVTSNAQDTHLLGQ